MIRTASIDGSPFVGVYAACNDSICLLPVGVDKTTIHIFSDTLGVEVHTLLIAGSPLIGSLVTMNSRGIVLTEFADMEEVSFLKDRMNILILDDVINAAGNDILANDKAAMVHPDMSRRSVREIEDVLDVEVVRGDIGGIKTVGSAAVVTNKGMVVHPQVEEAEMDCLKDLFGVPVYISTANYGSIYIGASVVANSRGAVAGEKCTPIEINRIEDALDIID